MLNEKISVIIPVYNVENYLEECLESVLNQTYKNIEIIAINDGSTDESLKILQKYKGQYNNIFIINQENQGQSVARNRGIENATGDFIYFLDSDDYIEEETFQNLIEEFRKKDVDLIRFSAEVFIENLELKVNKYKYKFDSHFDETKIYNKNEFLKIATKAYTPSPVLYIMKRRLLLENNIKFKPGIIHEDDIFTMEVFLNTNKSMYLPKSFYKRRYRKGSTMTINNLKHRKKSFDSRIVILNELQSLVSKYSDINEINFINKRIRKLIRILSRNYPDLKYKYKVSKVRDLEVPFVLFKYHFYLFKKVVGSIIRKK